MAKAKVQTTLRLDPEKYDAIQRAALAADMPVNTWIAQAVDEKLERETRRAARS